MACLTANRWRMGWVVSINLAIILLILIGPIREYRRVAQAFTPPTSAPQLGAPFLRGLCEGAGTTDAGSGAATPPVRETKSPSNPG